MSLELLIFPSVVFSEALSKSKIILQHIISTILKQEDANRFFINAIRILIFMISYSHGSILLEIELDDQNFFFLKQVLTLNTSMILDDLMFAIIDQKESFKKWIFSFDFYSLLEDLLTTPSYSSSFSRIIEFYHKFLITFKDDVIDEFENPTICESLFNISTNFTCLNCLKVINYILAKNTNSKDVDKKIGLLELIGQNINFFLETITNSQNIDGSYFFGPLQNESLKIVTYFIQHGDLELEQADWIFEIAKFLWEQFLSNPTNSFLHNSYLSYFAQIKKYETIFDEFIKNENFIEIILDIFSKQECTYASFFGQLFKISEIINISTKNGNINQQSSWLQFVKSVLNPRKKKLDKKDNLPCRDCYQKNADAFLKDCIDKDIIDKEIRTSENDSSSYDYAILEEEEEGFLEDEY